MANVRVTWGLPEITARQRPIAGTRIDVRVDPSFPWTMQDTVAPDGVQELLFVDVPSGTQYYRATVIDVDGREGVPAETSIVIEFDPPGSVVNLTATLE